MTSKSSAAVERWPAFVPGDVDPMVRGVDLSKLEGYQNGGVTTVNVPGAVDVSGNFSTPLTARG